VFSLTQGETDWIVTTDDGVAHHADRVILTAPIPQSFSLMFGGGIEMPTELRNTDYDRTLGLLVTLDSNNHNVSSPGGMQFPDNVFSFIGDNTAKGISAAPALTFHANPEWSLANFDKTNREIHDELLEAATPWLGTAQVTSSEMKKWRFAIPKKLWPEACWVDDSGTLAIAGDAFAGPRVEGAALSGLAAARALS
jgi:predicted NAD/FAD-dependent oxidoreductase